MATIFQNQPRAGQQPGTAPRVRPSAAPTQGRGPRRPAPGRPVPGQVNPQAVARFAPQGNFAAAGKVKVPPPQRPGGAPGAAPGPAGGAPPAGAPAGAGARSQAPAAAPGPGGIPAPGGLPQGLPGQRPGAPRRGRNGLPLGARPLGQPRLPGGASAIPARPGALAQRTPQRPGSFLGQQPSAFAQATQQLGF